MRRVIRLALQRKFPRLRPFNPVRIAPGKFQFAVIVQLEEFRLKLIAVHLQLNRLDFTADVGHRFQASLIQGAGGLGRKLNFAAFKVRKHHAVHFTIRVFVLEISREFHRCHGQFHIRTGHRLNGHGASGIANAQCQLQFLGATGNLIRDLAVFHGGSVTVIPAGKNGLRRIRKQRLESVRQISLYI